MDQDTSAGVDSVANPLRTLALAVSVAIAPIFNPVAEGFGFVNTPNNSNNSCDAIDLASGSCEFFNIWFLAYTESLPYTMTSMLPSFPKYGFSHQRSSRL